MTTPNLELPEIASSQAQKHVTHNEALAMLDAIVQLAVLDRDLTSPPGAPDEGDRYIVAAGATGAWDGQDGKVAVRQDGAWVFLSPRAGWLALIADEGEFFHYAGSAWASVAGTIATLQNLALLGIGTAADGTNPFSAKLNKALWTAKTAGEGGDGDLRYTMNKEGAGNVLSLLMQSGWSGRAELGLIGDDDLSLKVSPDGSAWTTALSFDKTTGQTNLLSGLLKIDRTSAGASVIINRTDGKAASVVAGANGCGFRFDDSGTFQIQRQASADLLSGGNSNIVTVISVAGSAPTNSLLISATGDLQMGGTNTVVDVNRHHRLRAYTVGTLPSASPAAQLIYVSDGSSNRRIAVSDGTDWRFADGNVVS